MKRVADPRDERVLVNTTRKVKQRLETIARASGWSLSLLVHEILQDWLEQQAPVEEDKDG